MSTRYGICDVDVPIPIVVIIGTTATGSNILWLPSILVISVFVSIGIRTRINWINLDSDGHIDQRTLIPNIVVLVPLDHIGSLMGHMAHTLNMGHGKQGTTLLFVAPSNTPTPSHISLFIRSIGRRGSIPYINITWPYMRWRSKVLFILDSTSSS